MLLADVNVLVYAHRDDSPRAEEHRSWLESALAADEPFGVSEFVLSAVLRIVTHHRIFPAPTPVDVALRFCQDIIEAPSSVIVKPGPRHWQIFSRLCVDVGARGNVIPDAYLAALAIEQGATWVTTDHGFARFPNLKWRLPLGEV